MTRAFRWLRCPHVRTVGIYGDRINYTPKGRRLRCLDCGRDLDGPVTLATGGLISGRTPLIARGDCMTINPPTPEAKETT